MKRIYTYVQLGLLGLIGTLAVSCKNEKLADVVNPNNNSNAKVNVSLDSKIDVVKGSSYTLTGADMTVPLKLTFSAPTSSVFSVNLSTNVDTIANLIAAGTLPAGTAAFPVGAAAVLPQITIPAGVTTYTTNIVVSRSAMEVVFGKTLAAVIKLGAIGKGNTAVTGKTTTILTVKTGDILDPASVHELYFGTGTSNIVNAVSSPSNYTLTSQTITFNVPVVLQGDPGAELTVDAVLSPDSVTKAINSGKLANSQTYDASKISYETKVKVLAGTNTAVFSFTTKINTLLAVQPGPGAPTVKYPTVAFTLANPTKYKVSDKANKTVYVVMDPNFFRPYYGTPFLIKGTIGVASDPIYAAYYDLGGQGIAYNDNNTKDGDGNWRLPDFVDVVGDSSPRTTVGWTADNEYLTYSIYVEETGTYTMAIYLGSSNNDGRATAFIDNVLVTPTPISVKTSGTNYGNQVPYFTDVTLTKGYHIYKFFMNTAKYDFRGTIFTRKS